MLPKTTMMGLGAEVVEAIESVSGEIERPVRASEPSSAMALRGATMVGLGPLHDRVSAVIVDEHTPLAEGAVFCGDFRVVRVIARGGMGTVYEAVQLSTGRRRALKVLHRRFAPNDPSSQRFLEEARVKSRVDSEHMVDVVVAGVDHASNALWIAMELLEGETLADRLLELPAGGTLPTEAVWRVLGQLCRGLARAHQQGVVHRDLKPANVFLARGANGPETVKLLDFGIAHIMGSDAGDSLALGTPLWMAPEQVTRGEITPATDVWAVGLIAFRLFTGHIYWLDSLAGEQTLQGLLDEITTEPLVSATARAEAHGSTRDLPAGFDAWFARCVARDPASRYRSARELAAALAEIMPAASSMPVLDYIARPTPARATRRPRVVTVSSPPARAAARSSPASAPPAEAPAATSSRPPERVETRRVVVDVEEAPTVRVRPVSAHHEELRPYGGYPRSDAPPPRSAPPRPDPWPPAPSRTAPPPSRTAPPPSRADSAPPRDLKRTALAVTVAFLLGGVTAFAVHLVTTPDTVSVAKPSPGAGRRDPSTGSIPGPPAWLAGASRAWSGSFAADNASWSFVLTLQIDGEATVAGQFAWTATRVPGATIGDRVIEQVTGTYEPTLGTLELTGTNSTNNVLFPVRQYRLHITPEGGVVGADARAESERLMGAPVELPRAR
jgi:serine/threonine-protein kinase